MITDADFALLKKLGIIVTDVQYTQHPVPVWDRKYYSDCDEPIMVETSGTFRINDEQFRPMCHLIRITDMICENKNPAVQELYDQLVTMLFLTEES